MIKYNTRFGIRAQNGSEKGAIRVRISYLSKRLELSLGGAVNVADFDGKREQAKKGVPQAREINRLISESRNKIDKLFESYEKPPTWEEARRDILTLFKKTTNTTLLNDAISEYLKQKGNGWTSKTYDRIRYELRFFARNSNTDKIDNVNKETVQKFTDMLIKGGYKNTSIDKKLEIINQFLRFYDIKVEMPKQKKIRGVSDIVYLTIEELEKLENYNGCYSFARDILLLCCYTGLRISDVRRLRQKDITENTIEIVAQKTRTRLTIDLNSNAKRIIARFKNDPILKGFCTDKSYNEQLKKIGAELGIDTPIREVYLSGTKEVERIRPKYTRLTSHVGRRTFVVLCLSKGIPPNVVMRWTGHSDYNSMLPYISILDKTKKEEMRKLDDLF